MDPNNHPQSASPPLGQWTTGLYDCHKDWSTCCLTCSVPWLVYGRLGEILDRGETSCCAACCKSITYNPQEGDYQTILRSKLRALYLLPEEPCGDNCVHSICICCAVCQEYRELKNRGIEPSKGWAFNASKIEGEATKPPIVASGMAR